MYLKVCGLREADNVNAILGLKPEWMGFIFVRSSPRYFDDAVQAVSIAGIPAPVKKVGVFADEPVQNILNLHRIHQFDFVQLHGNENVDDCKYLSERGVHIIKAFSIHNAFYFSILDNYMSWIDLLLFDTAGKLPGGNGISFNWQLLQGRRFKKPFLLSGGIGPGDVQALKNFNHPDMKGVDVNSRFEISPGIKDVSALQIFIQQIS